MGHQRYTDEFKRGNGSAGDGEGQPVKEVAERLGMSTYSL